MSSGVVHTINVGLIAGQSWKDLVVFTDYCNSMTEGCKRKEERRCASVLSLKESFTQPDGTPIDRREERNLNN